jgi:hypothetical protein
MQMIHEKVRCVHRIIIDLKQFSALLLISAIKTRKRGVFLDYEPKITTKALIPFIGVSTLQIVFLFFMQENNLSEGSNPAQLD